jgi:SAM-dependent methyltransferase
MISVGRAHSRLVYGRRVGVLAERVAALLPQRAQVLDVGCGDGFIDALIMEQRRDVRIQGIDVLVRGTLHIPVVPFDGMTIPFDDAVFDAVVLIDVLHHAEDPVRLLREARRVARDSIIIKDHVREGWLAQTTLRFMDWVGNAHHGVALPYHYWTGREWRQELAELGLSPRYWEARLGLYPWPASGVFERSLHFIARLDGVEGRAVGGLAQ